MAALLSPHPFAVEAVLARTTVLTFAAPAAKLEKLIPSCLQLDTFNNTWGFVAVALVQTVNLRPQGLPAWLGHSFFLIGYRVFVRFTTPAGKRLRGLYILKSETDKRHMEWLGNLLTNYRYTTVDIRQKTTENTWLIESDQADLIIEVTRAAIEPQLPDDSPFADWRQARRFAGPLPFTFSHEPDSRRVLIVEGRREEWHPQPVEVRQAHIGFLSHLGIEELQLASAFTLADIPYCWKRGRFEQWNG